MANDSSPNGLKEVADLLEDAKIGVLTTTSAEGHLVSRPLALQETEFDGELWFFTQDPSPKADEIRGNPEVNVAVHSKDGWVSIAGSAELVHDRAKIDELWSSSVAAWFENGKDDPTVSLIRVDAHTAEYWTSDAPKAVNMFKIAKAAVTSDRPNVGKNDVVDL
ncbi:pyridoxamine 5'-phosphate oxidase family protein [Arthrobacter roseus]|uniref:pyridoxamine 5'-phosphate oxidase family protein n=1 Tax=Arthrobacter roseus TaxID=136274 RepID=UPI001962C81F|nr:general stress protein 26 [Arthrobacter roseus]